MVVALHCACRNACVNVSKSPTESADRRARWLASLPEVGAAVMTAQLSGGGIQAKVGELLKSQLLEQDECTWKLTTCANCSTFLAATNNCDDDIFVNSELSTRTRAVSIVSPVWDIVLLGEEQSKSPADLFDVPDPSDKARHEIFKRLHEQASAFLEQKEREMEERIRLFQERQQKQLRELQDQVYREERILWEKIDAAQAFTAVSLPPKSTTVKKSPRGDTKRHSWSDKKAATPTTGSPAQKHSDASEIPPDPLLPPPPSSPAPLPPQDESTNAVETKQGTKSKPTQTWLASRVKKATIPTTDLVFALDDDSGSDGEVERFPISDDEADRQEEEEEEVDADDYYEPRPASVYQIASSLPVQIPSALMSFGNSTRKQAQQKATPTTVGGMADSYSSAGRNTPSTAVPSSRTGRVNPIAYTYQTSSTVGGDDDALLSKSFAVPDRRDAIRRRKFVF